VNIQHLMHNPDTHSSYESDNCI